LYYYPKKSANFAGILGESLLKWFRP
jgi:hypothetical protein